MNVLIYGYGLYEGGFASAMYFFKKGCKVRITDLRDETDLGESVKKLKELGIEIIAGAHRVEDFKWADLVVKTPAISTDNPFLQYAKTVTSEYSFLFENENVAKTKLICITGTKGKTITSEAVCHALNRLGKKTRICGSIESSTFTELECWEKGDVPDYLICKMSSWQIRDTYHYSEGFIPAVELAAITSPALNEKYEIFKTQTKYILCSQENKYTVKNQLNLSLRNISVIENNLIGIEESIPANLKIAYSILKRLGFKPNKINDALKSFKGVPHRMEIVSSGNNLLVINDSASTIPEAVNLNIQNFKNNPVHLICGGSNDKLAADTLCKICKSVASVYLLDGSFTQNRLIPMLDKERISYYGPYKKIEDAVNDFRKNCDNTKKMLQVLLLSPGAPASEYFANEFERGNLFKACFN